MRDSDRLLAKSQYDVVFCVLTYRNTEDLLQFIKTAEKIYSTYRIIVINSFFDDESERKMNHIATKNGCDYVSIPNKGYGYGNNVGIEYAFANYEFEFLVISNPDIEIKDLAAIEKYIGQTMIIAPQIIRNDGRNQNPMRVKQPWFSNYCAYLGFKHNVRFLEYVSIALNKLDRLFYKKDKSSSIYQAHGAFLIFTKNALMQLKPVFDEEMFLFCEESDLADCCAEGRIRIQYDPRIIVYHKEDGSMQFISDKVYAIKRASFIHYYEKHHNIQVKC